MAWDTAVPAGTDPISSGDDVIRTLKTDLQAAFRAQTTDGLIGSFPGASAAAPIFAYRGAIGTTAARPAASADVGLYHNTTLNTIQRCNGAAFVDVATLITSGTKMVFYQAAAPAGWTAVAVNDKFLRVVTAGTTGGATSGATAASTSLSHTHTMGNHTHSISSDGAHTHDLDPSGSGVTSGVGLNDTTTSNGAHTHSGATGVPSGNTTEADSASLGVLAAADVIIATKD